MSLDGSCGRLPISPLSAWERRRADAWVVEVLRVGVLHRPSVSASIAEGSHSLCKPPFQLHQKKSTSGGHSSSYREKGSHAFPLFSRVLRSDVRCSEGFWRAVSDHRPLHLEQIHCLYQVPHGNHEVSPAVHSSQRLDVFHQLEGCLPSGSDSSRISSSFLLCMSGTGLSVRDSVFRPDNHSAGFYLGHGLSVGHFSSGRGSDFQVSGRLANVGSFLGSCSAVEG